MQSGVITDSLKIETGSVVFADGMVYLYNQKGMVYLVKEDGGKLTEVSSFMVTQGTKEHFAHPFIGNGILYLWHGKTLLAYSLKAI
ncbi:MAG: hypothetical protein PHY99_00865 [Bacteroidales bacterium]|nr:hypothetical protein [Bacteroidales bacterium]